MSRKPGEKNQGKTLNSRNPCLPLHKGRKNKQGLLFFRTSCQIIKTICGLEIYNQE